MLIATFPESCASAIVTFGVSAMKSVARRTAAVSMTSDVIAVTATGASWRFSSRARGVTTIVSLTMAGGVDSPSVFSSS